MDVKNDYSFSEQISSQIDLEQKNYIKTNSNSNIEEDKSDQNKVSFLFLY